MSNFWTKKNILSLLLVVVCLALLTLFPTDGNILNLVTSGAVFLFLIPVLYIKMILKEPLGNFGFQIGDWKRGWAYAGFSMVGGLLVFYLFFSYFALLENYQMPVEIKTSFPVFLFFFVSAALFLMFYEFLFRGFLMNLLRGYAKFWAIVIQAIVFAAYFWVTGSMDWNALPYLVIAVFSGMVAYVSESLIYSVSFSLLYFLIFQSLIIGLSR